MNAAAADDRTGVVTHAAASPSRRLDRTRRPKLAMMMEAITTTML